MNIVLLSGGSGTRLWPLSNNIRSKQFIKLFKNDNDEYESMVQRVNRQIHNIDKSAKVVVATAKSQVSAILSQLGENTNISIEPSRKDTFPAIALACAYCKDNLHMGDDEPIIVCPVDSYVDDSFFSKLVLLENEIEQGYANLSLLGIEPDQPSEKFGYIIPSSTESVSTVNCFKEKPDKDTAVQYIEQGALWNGGVFAFKLSYILGISQKYLRYTTYEDLRNNYANLDKISFDYAVAEHEKKISVVRYDGAWKDLGTWNTLTDAMSSDIKGNGKIGSNCHNTNIVNETNLPILVEGLDDVVVSASPDGILVSDKEASLYIKNDVEEIRQDVMFAEKSWGRFRILDKEKNALTIKVTLYPNHSMGYHSHEYRDEIWTVISGNGVWNIDGIEKKISPGDSIKIKAGTKHSVEAITELKMIEIQSGSKISNSDKQKY